MNGSNLVPLGISRRLVDSLGKPGSGIASNRINSLIDEMMVKSYQFDPVLIFRFDSNVLGKCFEQKKI